MTGTVRTKTALEALMPAGTLGGVITQDILDFLYSVMGVWATVAKTASYSLTEDDTWVTVDATAGAVVLTLPEASTTRAGKFYFLQKIDSGGNAASYGRTGSNTLNSATSKSTTTQWGGLLAIRASSSTWAIFTLTGS